MQTLTRADVKAYLDSKLNAWAQSTQYSERARLTNNLAVINQGPEALAKLITNENRYSMKTLFIRASQLQAYAGKGDSYARFIKDNALLFKNAYSRKTVKVNFEEAVEAINKLKCDSVKQIAINMLSSGLRSREALTYDGRGSVIGKGGHQRDVFISSNLAQYNVSYNKLYKALRKVGLAPHDLRKLAATKLAEAGFKEADLLAVMGWTNIQTASLYLQPKNKQELQARVSQALLIKEM